MFNTVVLILRPDEIRLFMVLFGALVAGIARRLQAVLARGLKHDWLDVLGPLGGLLAGPIAVDPTAAASTEAGAVECGRIVDGTRCLVSRRTRMRPLTPPH